uniref:Gypsy retrotransposon integrase-like protein 1 n=1 Tax=Scleropages formosus TaxID=113540 RepID=A0A8C9UY15_SCLFO
MLRLQKYNLKVTYRPGKQMHIADTLSRAYLKEHTEELLEEELEINWITPQLPISDKKLQEFRKATAEDPEMIMLRNVIMNGWPAERSAVPKELQPYWTFKEEISYTSGLMFKAAKLIVPSQLREEMLDKIHESHLGIVKCKERARDIIFWPGMSTQIENKVSQCAKCNTHRNSNAKEPLIPHTLPGRPWAKIGTDLFQHNGSEYLLCVDYYSKFPEIAKLTDMTSQNVIIALKSMFARHGIPDIVISDNGPQYASLEFKCFAESWEFEHKTSSPGYAQSNGQAERAVQAIKTMVTKSEGEKGDPCIALLEYRNTPLDDIGLSPAQLLMGRRLKTKLPTSTTLLTPEGNWQIKEKLNHRQAKQKCYYDRHTQQLPEIAPGDNVRLRQGQVWKPATVLNKHECPRSFIVRTSEGKTYRRNRRHLMKTNEQESPLFDKETDMYTDSDKEETHEGNKDQAESALVNHTPPQEESQTQLTKTTRSGRVIRLPSRFRD